MQRAVRWLRARLLRRLPPATGGNRLLVYVASNLPGGVGCASLRPLCHVVEGVANCSDASALLGLGDLPEWRALLSHGVSAPNAALLLDVAISSSAGRGFFSTSKFCGPAGFRRSTFSEAVAVRWAQQRGAAPLCAHAMERALLEGMAAHGSFVY